MKTFRYDLRDRRYGKIFETNQSMQGTSKTDVRMALEQAWRRDVPYRARDTGFVPFRDVQIVWREEVK